MEEFNIEDYKDYKNVTIAEYVTAKKKVEDSFVSSLKQAKIKDALKYAGLYIELDKLLNKRVVNGSKYGYDKKGNSK